MLLIENIKLTLEEGEDCLAQRAAAVLRCAPGDIQHIKVLRRALDAREGADWRELTEPELDALCERAAREQRRFEEALSGILAYGEADMRRRPGEEV